MTFKRIVAVVAFATAVVGAFALRGDAVIAPPTVTDVAPSTIKDDSPQVTVFGISLISNGVPSPDTLTGAKVSFTSSVGFATSDLLGDTLATDCGGNATTCDGVQLWKDTSFAGSNDDVLDTGPSGDFPVSTGFSFNNDCSGGTCQATFTMPSTSIPTTAHGSYEFFIVIRSSSSIADGDKFHLTVPTDAFTASTPATLVSAVNSKDITADTTAPAAPTVSALGVGTSVGKVRVGATPVSSETSGVLEVRRSPNATCSGSTAVTESSLGDLSGTNTDLVGTNAAQTTALQGGFGTDFVCYRVRDAAGNVSPQTQDGKIPSAPSGATVNLLGVSNATGAKRVSAATDPSGPQTLRLYIAPGGSGLDRAKSQTGALVDLTTSASGATDTGTTDIKQFTSSTTLAAGDGVSYSVVNANGNDGAVTADGTIPAVPNATDLGHLSTSAADGHQRAIYDASDAGAPRSFGLYLNGSPAVTASGGTTPVRVSTSLSAGTDSGTTDVFFGATQLASAQTPKYVAVSGTGNESDLSAADGTIPAAPVASTTSASGALGNFVATAATATSHVNLYVGSAGQTATQAYDGTPNASASSSSATSAGGALAAGKTIYYTVTDTSSNSGNESATTADGDIPTAPVVGDLTHLATSAAGGHQRVSYDAADGAAPRNFRLYLDTAGGTAWARAATTSGGSTDVKVTTGGAPTDSGAPNTIFSGTTALTSGHAVGYALLDAASGNDSLVTAEGTIPVAPGAGTTSASAAAGTVSSTDSTAASNTLVYKSTSAVASTAYGEGLDATLDATQTKTLASTTADNFFYTRLTAATGNESPITADGAIPAFPGGSAANFSASAATGTASILPAQPTGNYRVYRTPSGGSLTSASSVTTHTTGGGSPTVITPVTGLAAADAIAYAHTDSTSGNESVLFADGTIPAAPSSVDDFSATAAGGTATIAATAPTAASPGGYRVFRTTTPTSASPTAHTSGTPNTIAISSPVLAAGDAMGYAVTDAATGGNESPILADGTIPTAPDASLFSASDALNRFDVVIPSGGSVSIFTDPSSTAATAYSHGADFSNVTATPFSGDPANGQFVFYTNKITASGNESTLTADGVIPNAPSGIDGIMGASAAAQQLTAEQDTSSRTIRLYGIPNGGATLTRASTTSGGATPVELVTSTSVTVQSGQGIFFGTTALGAGDSVSYSRVQNGNDSDVVNDGTIPSSPDQPTYFGANAQTASATISSSAPDGIYRVFRGSTPSSSQVAHSGGTPDTVAVTGLTTGDAMGYSLTDANNNESQVLADGVIPSVGTPDLTSADDSGASNSDDVTNVTTPHFDVAAPSTATATIFEGATTLGSAVAGGSNVATVQSSALSNGSHSIQARSLNTDGNTSFDSSALSITIDSAGPATPGVPDLQAGSDSGSSSTDNITNDNTPTFDVTGVESGATVKLFEGATQLGSAPESGGQAAVTSSSLSDGVHAVKATATDAAGNVSTASATLSVTIDTTLPATPATPDLQAASDSGSSSTDNITNDNTPSFDLTGLESGASVKLLEGATQLGTGSESGGQAAVTSSSLTDGVHAVKATETDAAGNTSSASSTLSVTIDTTSPATPAVPDLQAASDTGSSSTDNLTNDNTPTFDITGLESGATTTLFEGATQLGSGAESGGQAAVISSTLTDGAHAVKATATDAAGNTSAASSTLSVTIDTTLPTVPSTPDLQAASDSGSSSTDNITNDNTPTFDVTGVESGATAKILEGATQLGSGAESGGQAAVTSSTLTDGAHAVKATATDAAGNTSSASSTLSVTIDTAAPATPAVPDLQAGSDSGSSSTDNITNDNTPTFDITGLASGSTVTLLEGATQLGSGTESGGQAAVTSSSLSDGIHAVKATATDAAGNTSSASSTLSVTIDTAAAAPAAPDLQSGSDSGSSSTDNITNDNTPTFDVTGLESGATAKLLEGATQLGSGSESGGQSAVTSSSLTDGAHAVKATQTDAAGNASSASSTLSVTIDTAAPTVTLTAPTTIAGAATAQFNEAMSGVDGTNYVLRVTGSPTNLAGTVAYNSGTHAATLQPDAELTPGQNYTLIVAPSGSTAPQDAAGNAVATTSLAFRAGTTLGDTNSAAKYAWRSLTNASASGGSYTQDHLAGATSTFSFNGTAVSWYTVTGRQFGKAQVLIDGVAKATTNQYAPSGHFNISRNFSGLPAGDHTITVKVLGLRGSTNGTDSYVAIDAFRVGAVVSSTPDAVYTWQIAADAHASNSEYAQSNVTNSSVTFSFHGTAITWETITANRLGKAEVFIDGVSRGTIDSYSAATTYNVHRLFSGLTDADHTIKIVVLGTRSSASRGTSVIVDGWSVT